MTGGRPRVLVALERPAVTRIVTSVLELRGFEVESVHDGDAARAVLERERWDALVVDVGLPGVPGYELCEVAKRHEDRGAKVVVLVASVYRRTSYKRRPTRLYGADDYVEIHHLCDTLPTKLRKILGLEPHEVPTADEEVARAALREEGDARMAVHDSERLAALIVADMVLYNGDAVLTAATREDAERAIAEDLRMARELFEQFRRAEGVEEEGDPVGRAFGRLLDLLGRGGDGAG